MRYFPVLMISLFGLAGCGGDYKGPAPIINLGMHADSATGAIIVNPEDTLWAISRRYRLPVRDIIDLNGIEPPYALAPGQRLKLPAPVDYRVRHGDTLQNIANMFGVSVSQLAEVNHIRAPYRPQIGQELRIPSTRHSRPRAVEPVAPLISPPAKRFAEPRKTENIYTPLPPVSAAAKPGRFAWPVRGAIISGYGPKEDGLYNDGINIAAPRGTPVMAAADGVVAYVGSDLESYGNLILIRHGNGMMTAYAHLGGLNVRKGASVRKGQVIGTAGSTGSVSTSQLHFEIRQGSKTRDPRPYLD
jgi:murein DD-endopeptidase MepM/ murein hydrolase activator NlpD